MPPMWTDQPLSSGCSKVRRLAKDSAGSIAILAAVTLVPLAIAVTAAVDLANAGRIKVSLQAAADAAVLAAATAMASGHDNSDKQKIAENTFYANLSPQLLGAFPTSPAVTIDFPAQQVHMQVQVKTDQLLTSFITDAVTIGVEATAMVEKGEPICVLVFNEHLQQSFNIQGTAELTAADCAIHVNSGHQEGMRQSGNSKATAKAFFVHGNYSGTNYYPKKPKPGAMRQKDPLAKQFANDLKELGDITTCRSDHPGTIRSATVRGPGVYCGGLTVQQGTMRLEPGVHVIRDGELSISAQGTLTGDGVTILLAGDSNTRFNNQAGANLYLTAPSEGLFSGIVIAQVPSSVPSKENLIIGGGELDVEGVVYYPRQPLKITGNGVIGSNTSQFAIFADTLAVEGNGVLIINIGADFLSAVVSDVPLANETVRLAH